MERLLEIGFAKAGEWTLEGDRIKLRLINDADARNVLYAFIINEEICYIGKTTQTLKKRMYFYENPGETRSTNIKNNANILAALEKGNKVEIFALVDDGHQHLGGFHLNVAAGLEDSLIKKLRPRWNHGSLSHTQKPSRKGNRQKPMNKPHTFTVLIGKAYYEMGFFNVGIANSDSLGPDGAEISVKLGPSGREITATINRRANGNDTPRIMCGTVYRDWVQRHFQMGESFRVDIRNPLAIILQ